MTMRAPFAFALVMLVLAMPSATTAQQKPRGAPLTISLGGYRLGMSRRELPADMPCERDNAKLRQRGNWCTPRPGVGLVVVRDTVVAVWLLRTERADTTSVLARWRSDWLPRAEHAFGRPQDQLECYQLFGNPMACALDSVGGSGEVQATPEHFPVTAWWIGPEGARRARMILEGMKISVISEGQAPVAEYHVAFVLQCWPGERQPTVTARCVAPPYR
jgi:hypothetical protein